MHHTITPIAFYRGDFGEKFGVPRQAGIVPALEGLVVFEPSFRDAAALRGLGDFGRVWLIWQFSETPCEGFRPTVRPPRLGGNARMGVFATRSPFRPNALGLSCVELAGLEERPGLGTVLRVKGADLMDGTPIFDIKPYLPYADAWPDAKAGFAPDAGGTLAVELPQELEALIPADKREALRAVLARDPRPRYQEDADRVYTMNFAGREVSFTADETTLRVTAVRAAE
ncbi:MAG: tRNA (N6-threonylcarbamoyladenosine(37)-N6)-methyltransferase TrmO [Oscillospiraceae bacterium]|nr:tRNA (N6-threonylcarbamoyladenosine(37)-N6)-methyltransferase TrmO [Oscillospiraceae bacterium]